MTSVREAGVEAYVALGSNLGDREAHLDAACRELAKLSLPGTSLRASSRLQTPALLPEERADETQPDYLNAVVALQTDLEPLVLLESLQAIETQRGRQREGLPRWSARTLDLDLLLYGDHQMHTPRLTLPHPELLNREFVLRPLTELAPTLRLPGSGYRVADALAALS